MKIKSSTWRVLYGFTMFKLLVTYMYVTRNVLNPARRIEILSVELTKRVLKHITFVILKESVRNIYTSPLLDLLVYVYMTNKIKYRVCDL